MAKFKPWTFSHLEGFDNCPRRFYRTRVAYDIKEPESEILKWGNNVHKAMQDFTEKGTELPKEMAMFEGIAKKIDALPGLKMCEVKLAINRAFKPVNWFAQDAWCRGIIDLMIESPKRVVLLDYKTGKHKPSDQLKLYALLAFSHHPAVDDVQTAFVWLKEKKIDKETYTRDDIPELWKPMVARAKRLEDAYANDEWPPRPSGLCRGWCPVADCEFCERK